MLKTKRPYMKPLAVKGEMEFVGTLKGRTITYRITPKFATSPKRHYVRVHDYLQKDYLQKGPRIMQRLRNAGLNVESPGKVSKPKVTVSRYMGETLGKYLETQPKEKVKKALMDAFELVGKVNALGIVHGHPHRHNLVVGKNGRVGLIDFKLAKEVSPNWENPQSVYDAFRQDYDLLSAVMANTISDIWIVQAPYFRRLLEQYPCTDEVRDKVMYLIRQLIR